jgi:predicted TPR repeat methyltransferase
VRCRRCGVAFATQRDDVSRAIDRHQRDYFMANKGFLFENGEADVFSYLMPRVLFLWALGYPRYRPRRRRALDVGAGQGIMVRYLEFLGWDAWGVEISQWAVNFAREKLNCQHMIQGTLQDAGFEPGSFD